MSWRVPVLAYHANNISGDDYARNDHVALASDLRSLAAAGWQVVSAHRVAAALRGEAEAPPARSVAITFDDGAWFDWHDLEHPTWGPQPSFATLLRERCGVLPGVHATSFVIVSPEARAQLDRTCMVGNGWWGDEWWPEATREGLVAIESHSWDHNHETLPATVMGDASKGTFKNVATHAQADAEIRQAADWLDARLGRRSTLFAYPYGESNAYLREEYFPRFADEHRVRAAFGTQPEPVTPASDRWDVPRYVCGFHWKSPAEFEALLRDVKGPVLWGGQLSCPRVRADAWPAELATLRPPVFGYAFDMAKIPEIPEPLRGFLTITEIDDATLLVGPLFKRKFGDPPPDVGHHLVALYKQPDGALRLAGYSHMRAFGDVYLSGGSCSEGDTMRTMDPAHRDAILAHGGIWYLILKYAFARYHDDCDAFFGHCGDRRALEVAHAAGFIDCEHKPLIVLWHKELHPLVRKALTAKVEALGPF